MPIREVKSPISSSFGRGVGPGSSHPLSPGARSNPSARSRGDQASTLHPAEPTARVSLGNAEEGATVTVTGPEGRRPIGPREDRRDSYPTGEPQEHRSSVSDVTAEGPRHEPPAPPED
jgi:hypothetical protein